MLLALVFTSQTHSDEPWGAQIISYKSFHSVIRDFPLPTHEPRTKVTLPENPVIIVVPPSLNKGDPKAYALSQVGATQFYCVDQIFTHESHWNPFDYNKSSGAYGIPQAVPGSKMSTMGADWKTNPITQVKWGLNYMNQRYGSPCNAWEFWKKNLWY